MRGTTNPTGAPALGLARVGATGGSGVESGGEGGASGPGDAAAVASAVEPNGSATGGGGMVRVRVR